MKPKKIVAFLAVLAVWTFKVSAQPTINLGPFMGTIPAQSSQFSGGSRQTVDFGPFDIPGPGRIRFEVFSTPNIRQVVENIERHDSTVRTIEFNGQTISLRPDYPICNDPGSNPAICRSIWDPPSAGTLNFELLGPAVYNIFGEFSGHVAQDYTINVYYQRGPIVSEVIPNTGSTAGWGAVTIMGSDFAENAVVLFGGVAATDTVRVSMNEITCLTPPGVPGATDVIVLHPDPDKAPWNFGRPWGIFGVLSEGYTYETPPSPPELQPERLLGTYSGFFKEQRHIQVDPNSRQQYSDFPFDIPGAGRLRWEAWAFIPITGPVYGPPGDELNFEAFNDSTGVRGFTRGDGAPATTNVRCTSLTYEFGPVICDSTQIVNATGSGAGAFRVLGPQRISANFLDFISAPFQDWTVALWFADQPMVSGVQPPVGAVAGGTVVTITGSEFAEGVRVYFGENEASAVMVVDPNTITCITPSGDTGFVDVSVRLFTSLRGTLENGFEYGAGEVTPTTTPTVSATPQPSSTPTPSLTPSPIVTSTTTATLTPQPTPTVEEPTPTFDFDRVDDGEIDARDLVIIIVIIFSDEELSGRILFEFALYWMDFFP